MERFIGIRGFAHESAETSVAFVSRESVCVRFMYWFSERQPYSAMIFARGVTAGCLHSGPAVVVMNGLEKLKTVFQPPEFQGLVGALLSATGVASSTADGLVTFRLYDHLGDAHGVNIF